MMKMFDSVVDHFSYPAMRRPEFRWCSDRIAVAQRKQGLIAGDECIRFRVAHRGDQSSEYGLVIRVGQFGIADGIGFDEFRLDRERVDKIVDVSHAESMPVREFWQHAP